MRPVIFLALLFFVNLGCSQIKSKPITEVSQNELKNVLLVDVRTPEEYNAGHIDDAVNINWYDADFADRFNEIDKAQTIYVYCKMGVRSAKAQTRLNDLGFKNVVNLEGGYDTWIQAQK
ncbi:MAG: rhodanese-like domain-containing protein [Maribacter sp.]|nr:rhodanese-like domain-containing protein [Maribacter sp.]